MNKELTNIDRDLLDALTKSTYSMLKTSKLLGHSRIDVLKKVAVGMENRDINEEVKIIFLRWLKSLMDDIHY